MYSLETYKSLVKRELSEKRYYHSVCVMEESVALADVMGADAHKAAVAGILHDLCKEWSHDKQLQYLKTHDILVDIQTMQNPGVWHGIVASTFMEKELEIDDPEILGAVRWHTTGKKEMNALEKTIFIADFTSKDRNYPDCDRIRALIPDRITQAMVEGFAFGLSSALSNKAGLIFDAVEGYNYYIEQLNIKERNLNI